MKIKITKGALLPLAMFFASLLLYFATLHPSIFPSDPAEFMVAIGVNGVAHPPGYPLFTLLGKLASYLPFLTFAQRINFLSAFLGAATVGMTAHIIRRLTKSNLSAVFGAGTLAIAKSFWLYSVVAEVFTLHTFLLAIFANQVISFIKKPSKRNALLSIFALAINASNHHTAALLLPALVYIIFARRAAAGLKWNFIPLSALVSLTGLLPYMYVIIAARENPPLNWDNAVNLKNLIHLFLRRDFGTTTLAAGALAYTSKTSALGFFLKNIFRETFGLLPIFAAVGGAALIKEKKYLKIALLFWGFVSLGPVFMIISRLPVASLNQAAGLERFFMAPALFLAILAGVGSAALLRRLPTRMQLFSPIIVLILLLPANANLSAANQKNNFIYYTYSSELLASLPKGAIFLTTDDISDNGPQYLELIEKARPDITLIAITKTVTPWYRESLVAAYPELKELISGNPAETVKNLCRAYAAQGLVFSAGWPRQFAGAEEACLPVPDGLLTRLVPADTPFELENYIKKQTQFSDKFLSTLPAPKTRPDDLRTERLIYEISSQLDAVGDALRFRGNESGAILFYERATSNSLYWYRSLNKLAAIDVQKNALSEAADKTRESIKRNPDNPWSYYDLGIILFGMNDAYGAEDALNNFLSFGTDPQSPQAEMAQQALAQIKMQK